MAAIRLELVEGIDEAHCLDFANTVSERPAGPPNDSAPGFEAMLDWFVRKALLDKETRNDLLGLRRSDPRAVARFVDRARALREAVYDAFSSLAAGRPLPKAALALIESESRSALKALRLEGGGSGARLMVGGHSMDAPLHAVALSASALITGINAARVRECANSTCGWLFLDHSKNRSRKWCDMADCGNKMKARRHYAKLKTSKKAGP